MKVLIAEDDTNIRNGLAEVLEGEGYQVVAACDGQQALNLFKETQPDFICLDIMMPGLDGYEVCRRIRHTDPDVPVIFISAKSEEIDRVVGLELGADDFIMKPFGVREVIARIRAVTRRCMATRKKTEEQTEDNTCKPFAMGDLKIVPAELRAYREDTVIDLSLRDIKILELLFHNKGKVVDRDTFFDKCWGLDFMPNSRTLDQHIAQLRKRIEIDPRNPAIIHTVHGVGYRWED